MLATLSMADHDLFERMIDMTFPLHTSAEAGGPEALTQAIRTKTVSTVLACKEMLMQEPPERLSDFYGTVSSLLPLFRADLPRVDKLTYDPSPRQTVS